MCQATIVGLRPVSTGNYAAACVLRGLRTKSKAQGYHDPSLDLHVIMELPTDLLFEVCENQLPKLVCP